MAVKVANNTAGSNGLVPILLVFRHYPYIYSMDLLIPSIIQKVTAIN